MFPLCLRAPNNEQTKTDDVHHALTSITNETNFRVSHGQTRYYSTSCLFLSTLNQLGKHVDIFSSKDEIQTLTQVLNITSIIRNQEMIIEHPNPVFGASTDISYLKYSTSYLLIHIQKHETVNSVESGTAEEWVDCRKARYHIRMNNELIAWGHAKKEKRDLQVHLCEQMQVGEHDLCRHKGN